MRYNRNLTQQEMEYLTNYIQTIYELHGVSIVIMEGDLAQGFEIVQPVPIIEDDKERQANCVHTNVTDWVAYAWQAGRSDGQAIFCKDCGKVIEKK